MSLLFYGSLLVFLDFNWNIHDCVIEVFPDPLGWILIAMGINQLLAENSFLCGKDREHAMGMTIWMIPLSSMLYLSHLIGFWQRNFIGGAARIFEFILSVIMYVAYWKIADFVAAIEGGREWFGAENFQNAVLLVIFVAAFALILPFVFPHIVLAVVLQAILGAAIIWMLYILYCIKKRYYVML